MLRGRFLALGVMVAGLALTSCAGSQQQTAPPAGARDTLRVFPNPATLTGLGVELRLQGVSAGYTGGIYDLRGRLLRRFTTLERGRVFWDGRDENGVLVDPGVYFVRAQGSSGLARARFVLLH